MEENPFKAALEGDRREAEAAVSKKEKVGPGNTIYEVQTRTVADLGLVDRSTLDRLPKVAALSVRDLNDLAAEFSGVKTDNAQVAELSLEDLQDIEKVFFDFKVSAGRDLARLGLDRNVGNLKGSVDVSCCCCTPCCCCAATDMSHTA